MTWARQDAARWPRHTISGHTTGVESGKSDQQDAVQPEEWLTGSRQRRVGTGDGEKHFRERDLEEHAFSGKENQLGGGTGRNGGFSRRRGTVTTRINVAIAILAAATPLHGARPAAPRHRDCKSLRRDEQQAEKDGDELFHGTRRLFLGRSLGEFLHVGLGAFVEFLLAALATEFDLLPFINKGVSLHLGIGIELFT